MDGIAEAAPCALTTFKEVTPDRILETPDDVNQVNWRAFRASMGLGKSHEWGDANAAGQPDLRRSASSINEPAIATLHPGSVPHGEGATETARKVTGWLNDEAKRPVRPQAGDAERMRLLAALSSQL